jgi:hypothetical protein
MPNHQDRRCLNAQDIALLEREYLSSGLASRERAFLHCVFGRAAHIPSVASVLCEGYGQATSQACVSKIAAVPDGGIGGVVLGIAKNNALLKGSGV